MSRFRDFFQKIDGEFKQLQKLKKMSKEGASGEEISYQSLLDSLPNPEVTDESVKNHLLGHIRQSDPKVIMEKTLHLLDLCEQHRPHLAKEINQELGRE